MLNIISEPLLFAQLCVLEISLSGEKKRNQQNTAGTGVVKKSKIRTGSYSTAVEEIILSG